MDGRIDRMTYIVACTVEDEWAKLVLTVNLNSGKTLDLLLILTFSFLSFFVLFLDASTHLYMRVCPSVGRSVRRSVTLSSKSREINN